jgi:hypothetical protein
MRQRDLLTTTMAIAALGGLSLLATVVPDGLGLAQAAKGSGTPREYDSGGHAGYKIGLACVPCNHSNCNCNYVD